MKTIVSIHELDPVEIKPGDALEHYFELLEADVRSLWQNSGSLETVACPGCGSEATGEGLQRFGVAYATCADCGTLYAPQRPGTKDLEAYYRSSRSAALWRSEIYAPTIEARREKVVRPRAEWVGDGIAEHLPDARVILDASSHGHLLHEEILEVRPAIERIVSTNPLADLDFPVADPRVHPWSSMRNGGPESVDVVTAFDILDRIHDVRALIDDFHALLRPGGLLFATAPTVSGFEPLVLWERSSTIVPPDKLNLLSIEGFLRLFAPPRWEVIELSTPALFDVSAVLRAVEEDPEHPWPRFIRYLLTRRGPAMREHLLEFLQANRLASFARLAVRRV